MSFFGKLRERMFKSSSRLGADLDAVIGAPDTDQAKGSEAVADQPPAAHRDTRPGDPAGTGRDATTATQQGPDRTAQQPDQGVGTGPAAPAPRTPAAAPAAPAGPDAPAAAVGPGSSPPSGGETGAPAAQPPQPDDSGDSQGGVGLLGRLLGRGWADEARRVLDDAMLESLEEVLIRADMGVETAIGITANLAEGRYGRRVTAREIRTALADEIARIMTPVARPLPLYPRKPQVVLVVGVNGSGKTTTIGKLAAQLKGAGKSVMVAAGDTFRAAAVEQLQVWGQRAGVPVMTAPEGSDPASLAHDALARARAEGADLLLIDTAGRLQNRADLMEELAKIVRVLKKQDPEAPHNTLLVLDATTGQNALSQVETFRKMAQVTGLVMTKLDGTARGGVLVALADRFGLPIHAIGVGEQIDDLSPFEPEDFARALVGDAGADPAAGAGNAG